MYEKTTVIKVGGRKCPLLYNLAAMNEFEEHYDGLLSMADLFIGPQDEDGDEEAVKAAKNAERKKAERYYKRELPWLIATLAKQGYAISGTAEEPPTAEYVALHMAPIEVAQAMVGVFTAIARGNNSEHSNGEKTEIDLVLEELGKNAMSAAK